MKKLLICTAIWIHLKYIMLAKEYIHTPKKNHTAWLHNTGWFHLYEVLEKAKLTYSDKNQISSCLWEGMS